MRRPFRNMVTAALVAAAVVGAFTACSGGDSGQPPASPARTGQPTASASGPALKLSIFHATHFDGAFAAPSGVTFAHYAGLVKQLRSDPRNQPNLFVGNGDDVSGEFAVDAFNAAGLDANTYGFNELDFGLDRLSALIPRARYAFVSANVLDRRTGDVYGSATGARRFMIRDVGGVRLGLTGLITALGPRSVLGNPNVEIMEPADAMREVLPQIRAAGAQLVVVLSHLDTETEAQQLARAVPGIDLILGTHVGTPGSTPQRVNGTVISTPPWGVTAFGQLDMTVRGGRLASYQLRTHSVTTSAPADPAVAAVLRRAGIRPS